MSESSEVPGGGNDITHSGDESSPDRTLLRTNVARALSTEGFGSVKVLSREAAERVFTSKRQEILQLLHNEDVSSKRDLARKLERDPGAVHRDLEELIEADLINIDTDGRADRPYLTHDTIVIEPLVAPEAAIPEAEYTVENEP